jgi:hypothetical protein
VSKPNPEAVLFRKFPEGDLIALFPNDVVTDFGDVNSYQRIGQHGAANPELIQDLVPATPAEYAALLKELIQIGYSNLEVIRE